jgi:signal transduction histidine kinase/ActR/RegA family two-component response regulator
MAWAQSLAVLLLILNGLALVGYLYDVTFLYRPTSFIRISPSSAAAFVALAAGIIALRSEVGITRRLMSQGAGGYVVRRLLLFTLVAPIVLGWLLLAGERKGLYSASAAQALSATAIVAALTGVLLFFARSLDIIDHKHRQAREQAEAASRAKDEFLAMLGHELRNPLSPILTSLQLMKLRASGELERERSVIERQVQHMLRLVDDLLDVSRIARGKIDLRCRPVELSEIVESAVETTSPLLEERVHQLEIEVPREGLVVFADAERLAQVVSNLLSNAAKYTPPGGTIRVNGARVGDEVVVKVADNGVGIPPELLPRIFDLFVQGQRTLDRGPGGIGLGLAIVRSLVERHGGTVRAASEGRGKGSELAITLPAYVRPVEVAPVVETPAAAAEPVFSPRRVLVVDDNRDAAEMLSEALSLAGHDVHMAHDGPSALEAADQLRPSVVFLDIGLPVMDGYEVARRLRDRRWDDPPTLVAITGYGQPSDRAHASQAGFDRHLVKPVSVDEVLALAHSGGAAAQPDGPRR